MIWTVFSVFATLTLIALVVLSIRFWKDKSLVFKILMSGTVAMAFFILIPSFCSDYPVYTWPVVLNDVMQMFSLNYDFSNSAGVLAELPSWQATWYGILSTIVYVAAPLLLCGTLLTLVKDFTSVIKLAFSFGKDTYVFSELNDRSLALGESIKKEASGKPVIVYTGADESNKKEAEQAKKFGAVVFKIDILFLNLSLFKNRSIKFFLMGESESQNVDLALKMIPEYSKKENAEFYVFSSSISGELLLNTLRENSVNKIRRIDIVKSTVLNNLYTNGHRLFDSFAVTSDGIKHINAVIVGAGKYGSTLAKDLTWFCQMPGYEVRIDIFDSTPGFADRFKAECPELVEKSGLSGTMEDACYTLAFHECDINSYSFEEEFNRLDVPSYVFVALTEDDENIEAAVRMRSLCLRKKGGENTDIQTLHFNSGDKEKFGEIANHRKEKYRINLIGELEEVYSFNNILHPELEAKALKRHLNWGEEKDFWSSEYNYNSSKASVIHSEMKKYCNKKYNIVSGIDKDKKDRTEEELWLIRHLEHQRWNAYTRSIGFSWSGSTEKNSRNDIARRHNCLVEFSKLPPNEQIKDDD